MFLINWKYLFLLITVIISLSNGQEYIWTRTFNDGNGDPLFSGGYYYRSLINFIDIDADGDDDIFFLAGQEYDKFYLHYYRNIGTPDSSKYIRVTDKYSPHNYNYGYYSSQFPPMTTFADIDSDNDYDLFIAYGENLRLYENSGDSLNPVFDWDNYTIIVSLPTDYCNYPAFVDIDNDGDLDLFLEYLTKIQFYRNTGSPTNHNYVLEINDLFPSYSCHGNSALCDVDNDNDYDIFFNVSNPYNVFKFCYFENIGDSTNFNFQLTSDHYFEFDIWEASALKFIETSDNDNDQDQDFFIGFIKGPVYEYLNTGTPDSATWHLETKNFLDIDVSFLSNPQFVDIDNDSDLDLFATGEIGIWYFENTGDVFTPIFKFQSSFYDSIYDYMFGVTQIKFADIDTDEDYDLFTGNTDWQNSIRFYRNIGTADSASFFLEDSAIVLVNGSGANEPAPLFADIDNDGDLDLFVSERETVNPSEPAFNFFRNVGDPYNPVWYYESNNYFNLPYGVYDVWDYDADEDLDLIVGSNFYTGGNTVMFENIGTPDSAYYAFGSIIDPLYLDPMIHPHGTITLVDIDADDDQDAFLGTDLGGIFFFRNDGVVGIKELPTTIPSDFKLDQNYPNPFNSNTNITFELPINMQAAITIYNILGQKIRSLPMSRLAAGKHKITWDGRNDAGVEVSSGIYIYELKIQGNREEKSVSRKMLYLK